MTLTTISAPSSASSKLLVACTASGTASPGRNRSFTRRIRMLSHTSDSCAHRRTRCVCLRPSTMEIAVPHAPAPMTAISLTRSLSSPTIFCSGQQASDVVFVPNDDQQGRSCDQQQDRSGRALLRAEPPYQQRKCRRCNHAAQRNVPRERNNNNEQDESDDDSARRQRRKRPYRRGYSFTPFEAQPDRK